jgi:hypothetical protein
VNEQKVGTAQGRLCPPYGFSDCMALM